MYRIENRLCIIFSNRVVLLSLSMSLPRILCKPKLSIKPAFLSLLFSFHTCFRTLFFTEGITQFGTPGSRYEVTTNNEGDNPKPPLRRPIASRGLGHHPAAPSPSRKLLTQRSHSNHRRSHQSHTTRNYRCREDFRQRCENHIKMTTKYIIM